MISHVGETGGDAGKSAVFDLDEGRIVSFEYDLAAGAFTSVRAAPAALYGYSAEDWRAPGFLEQHLRPDERPALDEALDECQRGAGEIFRCFMLIAADGTVARILMLGRIDQIETDRPIISGQIVGFDAFETAQGCSAIRAGAGHDLMQFVADQLSHNVRTLSSVGELLERHLAAQNDDMGSEFAVEIRESIGNLALLVRHLRPLTANSWISVSRTEEALEALRGALPAPI